MQNKRMLWPVLLVFFLLSSCSQEEKPPQATQTSLPPPLGVTYCDINPSDVCLVGFGLDIEERLLVLFRADDLRYSNIYVRAKGPESEMELECQQSENFSENVYCLGESFPEGGLIKLYIYSKSDNMLMAIGVFDVHYGGLPEPDVVFGVDATETPPSEPAYPNPSYPNPSYPNPNATP